MASRANPVEVGAMTGLDGYRGAIHGVCLRVLRHPQDAEDATQEVLLEAARGAPGLRDPARFEALHAALPSILEEIGRQAGSTRGRGRPGRS